MAPSEAPYFSRSRWARAATRCTAVALLCAALPAAADFRVGAGSTNSIATARFDLACTDLIVTGTLNLNGGTFVNVRDVIVEPGGTLFGGNGSITLSRDFKVIPNGQFIQQSAQVLYNTNCGPGAPSEEVPVPILNTTLLALLGAVLASMGLLALGPSRARRRNTDSGANK